MDPATPPPLSAPIISSIPREAWLEVGTILCFPLGLSCCDSFQPTGQETSKHLSSCFVHPAYAFGNRGSDYRWGSGPFNSIIVRAGSDPFIPTSRSPYSRGGLWDPWNHVSSLLHPESLEVSRSFPTVQLFAKITGSFEEELKNHYG